MARVGTPADFWKILKSVSAAEIARDSNLPLKIALVGEKTARDEALHRLFDVSAPATALSLEVAPEDRPVSALIFQEYDSFLPEAGYPQTPNAFDLVLDVGALRHQAPEGYAYPIYSVSDVGGLEATWKRLLEDRPDWQMTLARHFPALRKEVGSRLIAQTATVNAQFALLTGITAAFPLTGVLLPVNSLSDIVALTKNQAMLALRLAAIYNLPVDYLKRSKELAPILGNAFGWRAIARELVGMVPFGGFLAKAMIAYAGTATIGAAAQFYYETGENLSRSQLKRLYQEAYIASKERVQKLAAGMRRKKGETETDNAVEEPAPLPAKEQSLDAERATEPEPAQTPEQTSEKNG